MSVPSRIVAAVTVLIVGRPSSRGPGGRPGAAAPRTTVVRSDQYDAADDHEGADVSELFHTPWSIEVSAVDGGTRLTLRGELDAATAVELGQHVSASPAGDVQVDLAGVTFMDSSGLAAILESHRRLAAQGRRLVLTQTSTAVQRVLELSGVSAHLDLGPD